MKKMLKVIQLSLLAALLFNTQANAQELQQVQDVFNRSQQNTLQEKVFVHTDKSTYVSGEIIWFKVYCVDANTHKPLNISKVVYIDVIDNAQNPVLQAKIALKNGLGNGSLTVPLTIGNGNYKLRGYTNWMKNFGPDVFFEKQLTIINTLRSPDEAQTPALAYDVQFFPEGGNMVAGLTNNIGFKAVGQNGKGIAFKGAIVNQANDTIARFQPLKFGMGHFKFTPVANDSYKAVIQIAGSKPLLKELPIVNSKGYVIQLTDAADRDIDVLVNSNTSDSRVYLFTHTGQVSKVVQSATLTNGAAHFTINKSSLDEGISHITLFNSTGQPVCERLYFKRPKQGFSITANADMQQYATRKKVNVQVVTKDAAGKMLSAALSMAIYRTDSLQATDENDILSYLWLSSDVKGNIESPGYYLKNNKAEANEAINNLMLTQGWRRFQWNNLMQNKTSALRFLPEYNGHLVTARVTDAATNTVAANVIAFMGVPGKRVQMYPAKSNADGLLLFNTKDFYGPGEIIVQTNTEIDTTHKIEVLSPFAEQYSKTALPAFKLTADMQRPLEAGSLSMQVQNIYAGNKLKHFYDPGVDSTAFYGPPRKSYKLDDYTRFTTMEEVLREYIREVNVFKPQGRFDVRMINAKGPLSSNPLVMLDGVPMFNVDKAMAIDPLKISRLQVLNERFYAGPAAFEGVMTFTTYKNDLAGVEMDPHAVIIDYEGMQLQREFYSPVYETADQQKSRTPDFRNLLFWSPNVNTGSHAATNVSFYTSDRAGKYFGLIQGITADGDAGVQPFTFEVK